jgi:hypothetical protein
LGTIDVLEIQGNQLARTHGLLAAIGYRIVD